MGKTLSLYKTQKVILNFLKSKNIESIDWNIFNQKLLDLSEDTYPRHTTIKKLNTYLEMLLLPQINNFENVTRDYEILNWVESLFSVAKPLLKIIKILNPYQCVIT